MSASLMALKLLLLLYGVEPPSTVLVLAIRYLYVTLNLKMDQHLVCVTILMEN